MLLIYGAEDAWTEAERTSCMVESMGIGERLAAEGKFLDSAPLQPVATATTMRVRDGRTLVTDGPFAETTEQLGGFYVLDLADLDEAIAVAGRLPPAKKGAVEIRPLSPLEGLPEPRPSSAAPREGPLRPYLLLCYDDESVWESAGPEELRAAQARAAARCRRLRDEGKFLSASPLRHSTTATCVRVRDGHRTLSDGPFTETHEVLGGYYLILAGSREEALGVAAEHPGVYSGAVEVRPLFDLSGLRDLQRHTS